MFQGLDAVDDLPALLEDDLFGGKIGLSSWATYWGKSGPVLLKNISLLPIKVGRARPHNLYSTTASH